MHRFEDIKKNDEVVKSLYKYYTKSGLCSPSLLEKMEFLQTIEWVILIKYLAIKNIIIIKKFILIRKAWKNNPF